MSVEFAEFKVLGTRVFDDDEVRRVAQIWAKENGCNFSCSRQSR